MRYILIKIFFLFLFTTISLGKEIEYEKINRFTKNWLSENEYFLHYGIYKNSKITFELKSIQAVKDETDETIMYVAELNPVGFILISTDDRQKPIIGYSSENNFDFSQVNNDVFLSAIISDLKNNLIKIRQKKVSIPIKTWEDYLSPKNKLEKTKNIKTIHGPFLESNWGQGYVDGNPVYNFYTPNHWPAGCVATAAAQILNFYKWPYQGNDKHGYNDNGKYLFADFGSTIYDWDNTLDLYTGKPFSLNNQKAAGLLTYHCAVALEMDFEYNGSTSSTPDLPEAFHNYFSTSGHYKSVSSTGFWNAMKNNMLDQRPAIISIKSTFHSIQHAAVVDGYFETNNKYHLNPGWYGNYNGWYDISGDWENDPMETYNIVIGAVKGILPSPQINDIERLGEHSFILSWKTSRYQKANFYELQQARSYSGPWTTISNTIVDSFYQFNNADLGSYYYKVRVNRDNIWWDYSNIKKIQLGTERAVIFQVDMTNTTMNDGDTLVIRGNTPPLSGNTNSPPMIKADTSNVYKLSLNFNYDYVGYKIIYRFFIKSADELIAESENREYILTSEPIQTLPVVYFDNVVGVNDNRTSIDRNFNLSQNYPNPFNPTTTIKYSISNSGPESIQLVHLDIYNLLGKKVASLVDEKQKAGYYEVEWNAANQPSGVYFYKLSNDKFLQIKKMTLIK